MVEHVTTCSIKIEYTIKFFGTKNSARSGRSDNVHVTFLAMITLSDVQSPTQTFIRKAILFIYISNNATSVANWTLYLSIISSYAHLTYPPPPHPRLAPGRFCHTMQEHESFLTNATISKNSAILTWRYYNGGLWDYFFLYFSSKSQK